MRPVPGVAPVVIRGIALVVALLPGLVACTGGPPGAGDGAAVTSGLATAGRAGPGRPLSVEEELGGSVYRRENCARCHTLFDTAPSAGPPILLAPRLPSPLDSRVGPDLGLEGHRRSDDWHQAHLYAPDVVVPGSRMTAYRHLFRPGADARPVPTAEARALVAWLQTLGREGRDLPAEMRLLDPAIPAPERRPDGERLAQGERLYTLHCVACHGVAGDGAGPAAALLARPPRDFTRGDYRFRSTPSGEAPRDADLFRSITLGAGTGSAMPGFAHLDSEERWALVRRIREFAPDLAGHAVTLDAGDEEPAAPPGDPTAAGAVLFAELGCAACHGAGGEGRAAPGDGSSWRDGSGRPIAATGDLRHPCGLRAGASEAAFRRALRNGVGPVMPSFALAIEGRPWAPAAIRLWLLSRDPERGAAGATPAGP